MELIGVILIWIGAMVVITYLFAFVDRFNLMHRQLGYLYDRAIFANFPQPEDKPEENDADDEAA